jgi:hypothetical protein
VLRGEPGSYARGDLVELLGGGEYQYHSHYFWTLPSQLVEGRGPWLIPDSDVDDLTEKQCMLLDAIPSNDDCYAVYSTPGKLEWGVGLKVGDTVLAQLPDRSGRGSSGGGQEGYSAAIIRWIGEVNGGDDQHHYFGVEIKVSVGDVSIG